MAHLRSYNISTVLLLTLFITGSFSLKSYSQAPQKWASSQIHHELQKLNFLGSVLYLGAHPDDENTRLISYLSNHLNARTAYLSLTRGDGGQNLIGPELKASLGMIRTHELLGARQKDGGEQFFTRAVDFGYSKHPDEALNIWGQEEMLHDVVQVLRTFKPDIIINRFNHRTPGTTHGHHTASALLSIMAYNAANDPTQFQDSAKQQGTWQAKRLFFNTSWWFYGSRENFEAADKTNIIEIETGVYYPWAGLSNGEIAALSRSMHKSQGFGSTGTRGEETEYLELVAGVLSAGPSAIFEGINTSWSRIEGGLAIGAILEPIEDQFNFVDPSVHVPDLIRALVLLEATPPSTWKASKTRDLKELIVQCAGLFIEATAIKAFTTPQGSITADIEIVNRSPLDFKLHRVVSDQLAFSDLFQPVSLKQNKKWTTQSAEAPLNLPVISTPYWLKQPATTGLYAVQDSSDIGRPKAPSAQIVSFNLSLDQLQFTLNRPLIYKYNDRVKGEVYAPFEVRPDLTIHMEQPVQLFTTKQAKKLAVTLKAHRDDLSGTLMIQHPETWTVQPADQTFSLESTGEEITLYFEVTPPNDDQVGTLIPLAQIGDQYFSEDLIDINYDHLPQLTALTPTITKAVRFNLQHQDQKIGYIQGAGDALPKHLSEMGYEVVLIDSNTLSAEDLGQIDALVMGIRAYNTETALPFKKNLINDFVSNGGTLLIQYQTTSGLLTQDLGPVPFKLGRDRVTDETAQVRRLKPNHPVLHKPNQIDDQDFDGWIQERGLYFASEWDPAFKPILSMNDANEEEKKGALIIASYGKGHVIYTGLSFFRQLPAGVPGAYKLLANLLAIGHD
ncbi:MAG: PIG-L family deacetylase [Flavobacteriaceae bacterium]|jgi:LmbE family N-acetylglucosaminyl deacetylase